MSHTHRDQPDERTGPGGPDGIRDRILAVYLDEVLGTATPPDLRARILDCLDQAGKTTTTPPDERRADPMAATPSTIYRHQPAWWNTAVLAATLLIAAMMFVLIMLRDDRPTPHIPAQPGPPPANDEASDRDAWTPPSETVTATTPLLIGHVLYSPVTGDRVASVEGIRNGEIWREWHESPGHPGIFTNSTREFVDAVTRLVITPAVPGVLDRKSWRVGERRYRLLESAAETILLGESLDGDELFRHTLPADRAKGHVEPFGNEIVWRCEKPASWRVLDANTGALLHDVTAPYDNVIAVSGSRDAIVHMKGQTATGPADVMQRINPAGKPVWTVGMPFAGTYYDDLVLTSVPATVQRRASVLLHTWHHMADSGVDLACIAEADGSLVWKSHAINLRVDHSKYWHHAYAAMRGDEIAVVSNGGGGHFIELRNPSTGEVRVRHQKGGSPDYTASEVFNAIHQARTITLFELGGPGLDKGHFHGYLIARTLPELAAEHHDAVAKGVAGCRRDAPVAGGSDTAYGVRAVKANGDQLDLVIRAADGWMSVSDGTMHTALPIEGADVQQLLRKLME
ncbi:MAG: hypothetical protein AB7K09_09580 [Planctomycetota bacterium]